MTIPAIHPDRLQSLNDQPIRQGEYVLYWMQQSKRSEYNHALEYAIEQANELKLSILVVFGLMDDYPEANLRHYTFMLEGLQDVQAHWADRGIPMAVHHGQPAEVALDAGRRAALIVCDRRYLSTSTGMADTGGCRRILRVMQVETDAIVPVETVSPRREHAARTIRRTIRPKIQKRLTDFMVELREKPVKYRATIRHVKSVDLSDLGAVLHGLNIDRSVAAVSHLHRGGTSTAKLRLEDFLQKRFAGYSERRNQPQTEYVSYMSMYLHFGQISPLYLALQVRRVPEARRAEVASFLDELIIQRELALNFVTYTPDYDAFTCLPAWAQGTLQAHRGDPCVFARVARSGQDARSVLECRVP